MIPNHSPWIQQIKNKRDAFSLNRDLNCDVAVVGGGIAGITTSFFILTQTNLNVVLIEADKVAHGATGHNAGQIASYFERPLSDLVDEFGFDLALDGQRSVESAWIILDEIIEQARLQVPIYRFAGYAGLTGFDQLIVHLRNNRHRLAGGLQAESIIVAEEWEDRKRIPAEYKDLYKVTTQKDIMDLLETNNTDYIACLSYKKGCMNSALFTEELLGYMVANYSDRFSFYEASPLTALTLNSKDAHLEVLSHAIKASRVVLCTNGFENFEIINDYGANIDTKFHHLVNGRIGYMSGYLEPMNNSPIAISYFLKNNNGNQDPTGENYFYLTRRQHENDGKDLYNLVCTGGPEKVLPNGATYSRHDFHSEETKYIIDDFLRNNYAKYKGENTEYDFSWHGLMGYTPTGIRRIGVEPCNPVLMYNLGCNGVGILPSIFGGKRIADILNGHNLPPSIFDPKDQRCEL